MRLGPRDRHHADGAAPHGVRDAVAGRVEALVSTNRGALLALAACLVPIGAFATAQLSPRAHVALSVLLLASAITIAAAVPRLKLGACVLSVAVSARYIWYRATQTIDIEPTIDSLLAVALFGAELYAFVVLLLGYFQTAITRRREPVPLPKDPAALPWVDVFVPSYNEDVELLRDTLLGALSMEYPNKTVYLLDDGRRPEAKALTEQLGCSYLTRSDNRGAKAGNVNAALKCTSGELIAFFDADHVPVRNFLGATVGFFLEDPKVALVQTPHYFYNPDQFERNLYLEGMVPSEQKLFYHAIQPGNDFWNAAFFCGSCAVIRRCAMEGIGGMAEETLTEDAHTALKMHAKGWRSVYYDVPLAAGIATERLSFYISQRIRWARGMAQVFRTDNPLLKRGLSLPQRLNYFAASWHFMFGVPRMVFLLAPLSYLLFGLHPVFADVREVMVMAAPHLALSYVGMAAVNRSYRHSFWPEVFETVMAPYAALVTTSALIAPKHGVFKVTTKGATNDRLWYDWRNAAPILVLLGLCVLGVFATAWRLENAPLEAATVAVAGAWNLYNIVILGAAASTALERPQRRTRHRIARRAAVTVVDLAGLEVARGASKNLSAGGALLELDHTEPLPPDVRVQLRHAGSVSPWLPAVVLEQRGDAGRRSLVRLRFEGLAPAERNALVPILYSDPESWVSDAYPADVPARAALAVGLVPLAALVGRADLVRRLVGHVDVNTLIDRHALVEQPVVVLPRRRTAVAILALAAAALVVGTVRASSVEVLDRVVPLDRWTGFTYSSRLDQLSRAVDELRVLRQDLVDASANRVPVRPGWEADLARVRRVYDLAHGKLSTIQGRSAEQALISVVRLLAEAAEAHEAGPGGSLVRRRIDAASTALEQATTALGLPP